MFQNSKHGALYFSEPNDYLAGACEVVTSENKNGWADTILALAIHCNTNTNHLLYY